MNAYEQTMADRLRRELVCSGGRMEDLPDDLRYFLKQQKREYTAKVSGPAVQPRATAPNVQPEPFHLADADEFLGRELEPRQSLLTDAETGSTVLYEKSLNQIFAFRGIGKSIVANALIKVLTQGGEFLRFKSDGGLRTLLVDGELPAVQLQERLKEFGHSSARVARKSDPSIPRKNQADCTLKSASRHRAMAPLAPPFL